MIKRYFVAVWLIFGALICAWLFPTLLLGSYCGSCKLNGLVDQPMDRLIDQGRGRCLVTIETREINRLIGLSTEKSLAIRTRKINRWIGSSI